MCPSGTSLGGGGRSSAPSLRSAFDVLDADRDGRISKEDLRRFYATNGGSGEDDVIGTMMSVADLNKDGFVEYEEFERVLANNKRNVVVVGGGGGTILEEAFKVMDKDGDGKLSLQDLKGYMRWAGLDASDDDILSMIRLGASHNNNDDAFVTFHDLLRILSF